jgi:tetratricopeptide (TPR) repeat protein
VQDQKAKIRQRLGLLIELERFEKAASLEPRLSRLGLLEDDSIRYALAYTYYKTGRLEKAETHAKRVLDPASYQKAIELHRAIDACRRSGWICE